MTKPRVTINELDGAIGSVPSGLDPMVVVGPADTGSLDPALYARTTALTAEYTRGPAVHAAAYAIQNFGRPVLFVRTGASVPGSFPAGGAVVQTGDGTVVTIVDDAGNAPNDDLECAWRVVTGGTIGVAGITYQWSLDGGRTWSGVESLGTATEFEFPDTGGVTIDFAAGDVSAGYRIDFETRAPNWNTTELGEALQRVRESIHTFDVVQIVGPIDAAALAVLGTQAAAFKSAGKPIVWVGNVRLPDLGETETAYAAAQAGFATAADSDGGLGAGATKLISGLDSRQYTRPITHYVAAHIANVEHHIDIADVNLTKSGVGASIRDANGNRDEHDEEIDPGLDGARFITLTTHPGIQGVYCTNPNIFSAAGSDIKFVQHRRVLNLAHRALLAYFKRRLSVDLRVDPDSGFILESEALEMERGAIRALANQLDQAPKASGWTVSISRTDNILATSTLTVQARVQPLAYPKFINIDLSLHNPALKVQVA